MFALKTSNSLKNLTSQSSVEFLSKVKVICGHAERSERATKSDAFVGWSRVHSASQTGVLGLRLCGRLGQAISISREQEELKPIERLRRLPVRASSTEILKPMGNNALEFK